MKYHKPNNVVHGSVKTAVGKVMTMEWMSGVETWTVTNNKPETDQQYNLRRVNTSHVDTALAYAKAIRERQDLERQPQCQPPQPQQPVSS